MPACKHRWNLQYLHMFLVATLTSQLPWSIHLYLSGAHSLILRRKKPLQPSHVIAPKWTPDDGALQTEHGNALKCSAIVGLFGFSWKEK